MSAELQKAIDSLRIRDVYLRRSSSYLADDFDPKYSPEANALAVQFKHVVTRGEVLALKEDDADIRIFRVYINLGTRWVVFPESTSEDGSGESDDETDVKAVIEAIFLAEYLIENEPGKDALDAFALKNASYHIWPYWREYLMNQCMRMNLSKIALPTVQFAANNNESTGGI